MLADLPKLPQLIYTLAADSRLGPTDYLNDQIWELAIGQGEPPSLALQTSFGLRARNMRIFPRFIEKEVIVNDPALFSSSVGVDFYSVNCIRIQFNPFSNLHVSLTYWIPNSHAIAGLMKITNLDNTSRRISTEWIGNLVPADGGQRMLASEFENIPILQGNTGLLFPIFFINDTEVQIGAGSYSSLIRTWEIPPGGSQELIWANCAEKSLKESFDQARELVLRKIDAEVARAEMLAARQVEIYTGEPSWDSAFRQVQNATFRLLMGSTEYLPHQSFVSSRKPDQGFSLKRDGSDYNHFWNGQSPHDTYYFCKLILPTHPEIAQGLIENFFFSVNSPGKVDWKPGLAGQRSQQLATPLLASMVWQVFEYTQDFHFLERVFPLVYDFIQLWLRPEHDRDQDGVPEWDHSLQTGFEDHPLFSLWHEWAFGTDITCVGCPDLSAYVFRECQALIKISTKLERLDIIDQLQVIIDKIRNVVQASWNEDEAIYHYWDRDSHYSQDINYLGSFSDTREIPIHRKFIYPKRLLIQIESQSTVSRGIQIFIHGVGTSGGHLVERLPPERFRWHLNRCAATSDRLYTEIEQITLEGVSPGDLITVQVVPHARIDQTNLLPLWAGIPEPSQAKMLVEKTIMNTDLFWQSYGISCLPVSYKINNSLGRYVDLLFNSLIIEGLLQYGYREAAAELYKHIMGAVTNALTRRHVFYQCYDSVTGEGLGEQNSLHGLPSLGLFLDILGVHIIDAKKIIISGFNPFPWSVTVKYQGTTILRQKEKTTIIFSNGQTVSHNDPEPHLIVVEQN